MLWPWLLKRLASSPSLPRKAWAPRTPTESTPTAPGLSPSPPLLHLTQLYLFCTSTAQTHFEVWTHRNSYTVVFLCWVSRAWWLLWWHTWKLYGLSCQLSFSERLFLAWIFYPEKPQVGSHQLRLCGFSKSLPPLWEGRATQWVALWQLLIPVYI